MQKNGIEEGPKNLKLRVSEEELSGVHEEAIKDALSLANYIRTKIGLEPTGYSIRMPKGFEERRKLKLNLFLKQLSHLAYDKNCPTLLVISVSDYIELRDKLLSAGQIDCLPEIIAEIQHSLRSGLTEFSTYSHNPPRRHFKKQYEALVHLAKAEARLKKYPLPDSFDVDVYTVYRQ